MEFITGVLNTQSQLKRVKNPSKKNLKTKNKMPIVDLQIKKKSPQIPKKNLQKILKKLLSDLEFEDSELSLLFTDDKEIAELNKKYRDKSGPTDVLSFSQKEGEGVESNHLGDLVISLETAERQAEEYGVSFEEEILRLVIHGLLHLCGYEHEGVSEEEAERMFAKQEELYSQSRGLLFSTARP